MSRNLRMRKAFTAHLAVVTATIRRTAGRIAPKWLQMGVLLIRVTDAGSLARLGAEPALESRRG
jgi:hypothetical protein